jgi:hypothetical protein
MRRIRGRPRTLRDRRRRAVALTQISKSEPIMSSIPLPFAIPAKLSLGHRRVLDYWEGLKRGENRMPFWDDLKLTSLPDLADRLMLVDAFDKPQRFRLNSVGERIRKRYGVDLADKFVDEISPKAPFEFLTAQASATVEATAPTFFAGEAGTASGPHQVYSRLLLPMWGEGRVGLMLGAIEDLA